MYNVRRRFFLFLLAAISISLSAQNFSADREMFDAYKREDMTVWKAYIDSYQPSGSSHQILLYEYGRRQRSGKAVRCTFSCGCRGLQRSTTHRTLRNVHERCICLRVKTTSVFSSCQSDEYGEGSDTISALRSARAGLLRHLSLLCPKALRQQKRGFTLF